MPLKSPEDVLQFWFGGKFDDGNKMSSMAGVGELSPLWFGVHMTTAGRMKPIDEAHRLKVDESCRPFAETIRAAARGELSGDQWETERGLYAKMVLCDQLSRNCFRGTKEAFAADKIGLQCFRRLAKRSVHESWPLIKFLFLLTCPQHSEDVRDHELGMEVLVFLRTKFTAESDIQFLRMQKVMMKQHGDVIKKFGRYPHRNELFGRVTTPEEKAWLMDPKRPHWAKSQGKRTAEPKFSSTVVAGATLVVLLALAGAMAWNYWVQKERTGETSSKTASSGEVDDGDWM